MILIIDGYNLIKHITGRKSVSHAELTQFINEIALYVKSRTLRASIVFDGGQSAYPEISKHGALTVIFSGYKESADEFIINYVTNHKDYEILLISDDRQLCEHVKTAGKQTFGTYDFYYKFIKQKPADRATQSSAPLVKLTAQDQPELDELMSDASYDAPYKSEDGIVTHVSVPKRSKKERARDRLLEKLRKK